MQPRYSNQDLLGARGEPIAALFGLETLMGQLNLRNDKRAPPAAFWGFWGEYLDLEREILEWLESTQDGLMTVGVMVPAERSSSMWPKRPRNSNVSVAAVSS